MLEEQIESCCDRLDAWLMGELSPAEAERFAAHLDVCQACRKAAEQQAWIDSLLRSPEAERLQRVPAALVESIRTSGAETKLVGVLAAPPRRMRRRRVASALAAAAVLLVVAAWSFMAMRGDSGPVHGEPSGTAAIEPDGDRGLPRPEPTAIARDDTLSEGLAAELPQPATFTGGEGMIVVPLPSPSPNVTVVQLYATVNSQFNGSVKPADRPPLWTD